MFAELPVPERKCGDDIKVGLAPPYEDYGRCGQFTDTSQHRDVGYYV